ncbi:hypothetical protein ABEB36_009367 [Hypothenemus hampei]|uniref:Uncharacterized protein n=1 Tax=Hypothenemus hampei TaxID=57062 RepID=A0ABD1EGG9_HYPHA
MRPAFWANKTSFEKHDRMYIPDEYYNWIITASTSFKYSVRIISRASREILDYKNWWTVWYKKNTVSIESVTCKIPKSQKTQFTIAKFNEFMFHSEYPGCIKARDFIDGLAIHTFVVRTSSRLPIMPKYSAYISDIIPINIKKINDIKKVMQYIPDEYAEFWNVLCNWPTTNSDADE